MVGVSGKEMVVMVGTSGKEMVGMVTGSGTVVEVVEVCGGG